ncbi:MAG: SDR family oxidoreductase [Pseudomonadota bacterium]
MSADWADAQVLVTGASSGIGLATARRFADAGATVVGASRRPCPDARVRSLEVDLTAANWSDIVAAGLAAHLTEGRRTVVVHNAAELVSDALHDADPAALRRLLELNVVVPMMLSQRLLRFCGNGSALIFVGSTLSEKAVANTLSYTVSKHAVLGLMRACTQDLAGRRVHAVAVCPGFTDTEMLRARIPDDEVRTSIGANNAFGRLVTPDEIAATIDYCAASPVMNGAVVHANLGQLEV